MASAKSKREYKVADSSRRLAEHVTGGAHLRLPRGIPLFDPKKGIVYEIDFIPYELSKKSLEFKKNYAEVGDLYVERTYSMHYGVGPDRDKVICLARTFGRPCPVCEYRNSIAENPNHDKEVVKKLYSKERQLWLVYVHQEKEKGLQLWDISNWCFGRNRDDKINNSSPKKKPGYLQHYHPTQGFTLRVTNSEKAADDRGGKFLEFFVDEFQERDDELNEEIAKLVEKAPCLDEVPNALSYKELKQLFLQIDKGAEKEEETERDGSPARNGKAKAQDEEEEEEEEDEDDPEEEEEKEAEDDDEPAKVEYKKGMEVKFEFKGKRIAGTILKVDKEHDMAHIKSEAREQPHIVELDDLFPADDEPADEDTPKRPTRKGK